MNCTLDALIHILGQFFQGKKHGQGKYMYANGDVYEGAWEADLKHGHGVYSFAGIGVHVGPHSDSTMMSHLRFRNRENGEMESYKGLVKLFSPLCVSRATLPTATQWKDKPKYNTINWVCTSKP